MKALRMLAAFALLLTVSAPASVSAQPSAPGLGSWQPGPNAAGDNTYAGLLDGPANGASVSRANPLTVVGWFVDTTAQGWAGADDLQVFNGPAGQGGTMVARGIVGTNRPDVAGALNNGYWRASGLYATVPGGALPNGAVTLNVYVHTPGKGWWFRPLALTVGGQAPSGAASPAPAAAAPAPSAAAPTTGVNGGPPTVTITNPTQHQRVSASSDFTITGSATDPANGAKAIDRVEVWINGQRNTQYGTLLGNASLDGSGGWTLTFSPTKFPSINSNLYVYAHSSVTNLLGSANVNFDIFG